jgi:hypothetical protein
MGIVFEKKQKQSIPVIVWWIHTVVVRFGEGAGEIMGRAQGE